MTRRLRILFVLAALLLAGTTAVPAQNVADPPRESVYRLSPESRFEEGCFDPCLCPVHFTENLIGTLRLAPAVPDPVYTVFDVREVNWFVPVLEHWVTGSGTYRIGGGAVPLHQLTLDLRVGDREAQRFDSGLVPVGAGLPGIAITLSMNGMYCHDTVFHLVAKPILLHEITPYALARSSYDEGCFGPCDCATTSRPLIGRFGLLTLAGDAAGADYAVLGFHGLVRETDAAAADAGWPVDGYGIYRVGAVAREQRLRLALVEDGRDPARFDSGTVPGDGNLKRIDVDVAGNGFACYDRVYSIHARRRPPAVMNFQVIAPDPVDRTVRPAP